MSLQGTAFRDPPDQTSKQLFDSKLRAQFHGLFAHKCGITKVLAARPADLY